MKRLIVAVAAAILSCAALMLPCVASGEISDTFGGRPSLPGNAGLWAGFTGNNQWDANSQVKPGESRFLGAYPAYINDATHWFGVKADGSQSECWWGGDQTYYYEGYMYFYDAVYTFIACIDDAAALEIDGTALITSPTYNDSKLAPKATWMPPRGAGWYPIKIRVGNGGGGYGPIGDSIGLGWNTTGYTANDSSDNWRKFIDPGDGTLLRTTPEEPLDIVGGIVQASASSKKIYLDFTAVADLAGSTAYIAFTTNPTGYSAEGLEWSQLAAPLVSGQQSVVVDGPADATYVVVTAVKDEKRYWTKYVALSDFQTFTDEQPVAVLDSATVSAEGALSAQLTVKDLGGAESVTATFKVTTAGGEVVETEFENLGLGTAQYALQGLVPDRTQTVTAIVSNTGDSADAVNSFEVYFDSASAGGSGLPVVPASIPYVAPSWQIDATGGDWVGIAASLLQTGSGETASVDFEYSLSADLSDSVVISLGSFAANAPIEKTFAAQPGTTYYYRFIATGQDGKKDITDTDSFATKAGAAFGGPLAATFTQNVVTYTATIADLGASNRVELALLTGTAENALVTNATRVVTETGTVTFEVTYPFLDGKILAKVVADNACATAAWQTETPLLTVEMVDYTTYTWNEGVTEGEWTDPANWTASIVNQYALYPNSSKARANFKNCTVPTTVYVNGTVVVDIIQDENNNVLDLTFKRSPNAETATIHVWATWWDGFGGSTVTIDGLNYWCHDGKYMNLAYLKVTNGATFETAQETQWHKAGSVLEVSNGALWHQTDWTLSMHGAGSTFILDNATFKGNAQIWLARTSDGDGDAIIVKGKNPVFDCPGVISGRDSAPSVKPKIIFSIPEGGYTTAPFTRGDFLNGKVNTDLLIDPKSPVFAGKKVSTKLVDGATIYKSKIEHDGQTRPGRFALRYDGGTEENPTQLWFDFKQKGFSVVVH